MIRLNDELTAEVERLTKERAELLDMASDLVSLTHRADHAWDDDDYGRRDSYGARLTELATEKP
jgi:hypothetical protein